MQHKYKTHIIKKTRGIKLLMYTDRSKYERRPSECKKYN